MASDATSYKSSVRLRNRLVVIALGAVALTLWTAAAQAVPGARDATFGNGGLVLSDFGLGSDDSAYAITTVAGKNILVAGETDALGSDDFALAEYKWSGKPNTKFAGGGVAINDLNGASDDTPYGIAVQKDGRIDVAGESDAGDRDFAVAQYTSNGALDPSFGAGGVSLTDIGLGSDDSAYGVTVQKDGKVVAVGRTNANGGYDIALVRYQKNGVLDPTFGLGGIVITDLGGFEEGRAVAIEADGKIVVAGYTNTLGSYDFVVLQYNQNGTLDTNFGIGGATITDFGGDDVARSLAIQPNGRIILAGYSNVLGTFDFAVAAYSAKGVLALNFGINGGTLVDLGGEDTALSVTLDGGRILLGGTSQNASNDFGVVRLRGNGTPDPSFGTGGIVVDDLGFSSDDSLRAVAIRGDKALAAGESDANGSSDFAITRYNAP